MCRRRGQRRPSAAPGSTAAPRKSLRSAASVVPRADTSLSTRARPALQHVRQAVGRALRRREAAEALLEQRPLPHPRDRRPRQTGTAPTLGRSRPTRRRRLVRPPTVRTGEARASSAAAPRRRRLRRHRCEDDGTERCSGAATTSTSRRRRLTTIADAVHQLRRRVPVENRARRDRSAPAAERARRTARPDRRRPRRSARRPRLESPGLGDSHDRRRRPRPSPAGPSAALVAVEHPPAHRRRNRGADHLDERAGRRHGHGRRDPRSSGLHTIEPVEGRAAVAAEGDGARARRPCGPSRPVKRRRARRRHRPARWRPRAAGARRREREARRAFRPVSAPRRGPGAGVPAHRAEGPPRRAGRRHAPTAPSRRARISRAITCSLPGASARTQSTASNGSVGPDTRTAQLVGRRVERSHHLPSPRSSRCSRPASTDPRSPWPHSGRSGRDADGHGSSSVDDRARPANCAGPRST